jgi:hypothetical protein
MIYEVYRSSKVDNKFLVNVPSGAKEWKLNNIYVNSAGLVSFLSDVATVT